MPSLSLSLSLSLSALLVLGVNDTGEFKGLEFFKQQLREGASHANSASMRPGGVPHCCSFYRYTRRKETLRGITDYHSAARG